MGDQPERWYLEELAKYKYNTSDADIALLNYEELLKISDEVCE